VAAIVSLWWLDLHLHMQSVSITAKFVSGGIQIHLCHLTTGGIQTHLCHLTTDGIQTHLCHLTTGGIQTHLCHLITGGIQTHKMSPHHRWNSNSQI
jgi:hypothetical protein